MLDPFGFRDTRIGVELSGDGEIKSRMRWNKTFKCNKKNEDRNTRARYKGIALRPSCNFAVTAFVYRTRISEAGREEEGHATRRSKRVPVHVQAILLVGQTPEQPTAAIHGGIKIPAGAATISRSTGLLG